MIKCAHCKEQLSAYLDGIMAAEEKELIEEHLSLCEHCNLALSELIKTQETLHNLEEIEPPPWFTQKIMNRVREEAEPRKGLLRRLFYPLHIKIPIEALATCLIVILALFVNKNTEPEMDAIHGPQESATTLSQDQAQTQNQVRRIPSPPAPDTKEGKSVGMQKEDQERRRNTINPARPESAEVVGGMVKDTPPAGVSKQQMAENSTQGTGSRYEAKIGEAEILKKQEAMPAQKSVAAPAARLKEDSVSPPGGSTAVKGTQEVMKAPKAREIQARSIIEPKQIFFTVSTNNIETTVNETEGLLNRFGAKNINKSSRQSRSIILNADLPGLKIEEFSNTLKTMGDVKGKDVPSKSQEDYLPVRIEITANP